ncbi:peptidyl-tRNA hydrolase, PTH1 family [Peptoclostridium litorale DSM 5388]|uniref:Peptidyl-tRNA hydrolase n=1 Tax=Peptoclostridium litorale DSM 5388 TaxID=1121324 RepID=A0A069RBV2_PEPLI|nr:aminoacyl-tRNA hydrolase [Peptoclostridium litorale]KDR94243.1 peptidyl-tRNA hydrolase Pth [Peptoclostridium litorale DSM 5388]SIO28050.1 peptidyl-tRNA hydrolase, PTH1 family [Peptoclostridium litorale DSM 5388]
MYVIVGLGNPGRQYEGTRHNVGFDVIDILADENGIELKKLKHKSLVGEGRIAGQKVLLVKPQTYMNLSGEALLDIYNYYKVSPEELIVIYDDIDTDLGKLRIRKKGSAGTHNGMKSIIYNLQFDTFPRVRIGVGRPEKGRDLASFVLSRFEKDAMEDVKSVLKSASQSVEAIIKEGVDAAMNKFNS